MAEASAFDHLGAELEERTMLDRLEARGTVRLAPGTGSADTPDAVFARLGGGAGAER